MDSEQVATFADKENKIFNVNFEENCRTRDVDPLNRRPEGHWMHYNILVVGNSLLLEPHLDQRIVADSTTMVRWLFHLVKL